MTAFRALGHRARLLEAYSRAGAAAGLAGAVALKQRMPRGVCRKIHCRGPTAPPASLFDWSHSASRPCVAGADDARRTAQELVVERREWSLPASRQEQREGPLSARTS